MSYPKVILFTGAGTNITLDLPTTPQFLDRIKKDEIKIREKDLFYTLTSLNYVTDIEQVWYLLYMLENFNQQFSTSDLLLRFGDFRMHTGSRINWKDFIRKVKSLKSDVEKGIFDVYSLELEKEKDAGALYRALFTRLMKINQNELPIFTTNYDRVVDAVYFECFRGYWNFIDGFKSKGEDRIIDLARFNQQLKRPTIKLIQLHGSLRWRKKADGKIVKVKMEAPPNITRTYKEPILIYPGLKSIDEDYPFNILYELFKKYLLKAYYCVIIGTSFRDIRLNKLFLDAMSKNSKLKLIIISPHATDTTEVASKNEFQGINIYFKRLNFINKPFDVSFDSEIIEEFI